MGPSRTINPLFENDKHILEMDKNQAIEVIMDTYGDEIKRLIFTYVRNLADTDDVIQEVFVTIFKKLDTFQGQSSLRSWIYSISINKSKDYLRSWHSRNHRLKEKLSHFTQEPAETPESQALQRMEGNELLVKVMQLKAKYREAIVLYYFEDFSTIEMGEILRIKEGTVRTRLKRAREMLKESLSSERGDVHG